MHTRLILILITVVLLVATTLVQAQNGYTTWTDPHANEFSLEVPQGWTTQGGSYIDSTGTDCYYVSTSSPDGSIAVTLGDPRVASTYNSQRTQQMSGEQFAKWYYQNYIASEISGANVENEKNFGNGAGGLEYTYSGNVGEVYAQTASNGMAWYIKLLFSFVAPSSETNVAQSVVLHMVQTTKWNYQQRAQQQETLSNNILNNVIGPNGVVTNEDTAAQHATNQWSSYLGGNDNIGNRYVWNCDGKTVTTDSYENPGGCDLEY